MNWSGVTGDPYLVNLQISLLKVFQRYTRKRDNRNVYNTGQGHILYLELLMTGMII